MSTIEIHGQLWRIEDIREDIEWVKNQSWTSKKYAKPDDHEHCLICYWTICESEDFENSHAYHFGGSTWLCNECYMNFVFKEEQL